MYLKRPDEKLYCMDREDTTNAPCIVPSCTKPAYTVLKSAGHWKKVS